MARNQGRHRISRRTKIATGSIALAIALGGTALAVTSGDTGKASADGADKSLFVDINDVEPNVDEVDQRRGASTGTFTVDCGKNENGHFNPDNFIAQPGVKNGAEHLHDYVGNLTTNADSNNKSLQAGGTTCENGDKSAYYWPVLRIDTEDEESEDNPKGENSSKQKLSAQRNDAVVNAAKPRVECPDVASQLADVPDQAMAEVNRELQNLDNQVDEADKRLADTQGQGGPDFVDNAVLGPLKEKRVAAINRIATAIGRNAARPEGLDSQAECKLKDKNNNIDGIDNGDENSEGDDDAPEELPDPDDNNELPNNDGEIQLAKSVKLEFRGSPVGKVTAMPKFLRVLTGDAKVSTNGEKNARAAFTCTGFEDRISEKYVICPEGSDVQRIHDFPSCWDGQNIDSENHRDHIVFPNADGQCAKGFKAVPQLRITLTYEIPVEVQENGQYKVDSFPEEDHNPLSDHDDFANVMSQSIMNRVVNCINRGKTCNE